MKVTLDIEETKIPFFMELVRNLKFIKYDDGLDDDFSDAHIKIISERLDAIKKDPSRLSPMEDFIKEIDNSLL